MCLFSRILNDDSLAGEGVNAISNTDCSSRSDMSCHHLIIRSLKVLLTLGLEIMTLERGPISDISILHTPVPEVLNCEHGDVGMRPAPADIILV